jgi:hypothetical protein
MRKLIGILVVIAIFVVGLGFYRGWFTLSSSNPEADADKVSVNVTVDRGKMKEDAKSVKEKTRELTNKAKETASQSGK